LVIEAAIENLVVKRQIVAELEAAVAEDTIIGTNTSAIPLADIAADCANSSRVVGIHFFSPVHRMPLVEVVRGPKASDDAVAAAIAFGRKLGKNVVVVSDGPGFYTTRVLGFMLAEAARVFEEGASIPEIDAAMVDFGFPLGPMELMDEVGLDVAIHVAETLRLAFPDRVDESMLLAQMTRSGLRGKRSGAGFYRYDTGKKTVNADVQGPRGSRSEARGPAKIRERLSLMFVNEAAHCLSERIVSSARDGDLAAVFGLGFPPFRGGPFRYVDSLGPGEVVRRLEGLQRQFGARFAPAACLVESANLGVLFRPPPVHA
jgi:3-hydroxyacyl-CoA dehydrogenase/enoyl-CoA hydratase/3-hydroxybutyryl-CoA epimerase